MLNQFSRTELLIGKEGIEKLQNSKVAVFGLGGVGSFVVEGLVRAGVGHLVIVDYDKYDLTNINRQLGAMHSTIGKYKVDVMKARILDINPNAHVNCFKCFYLPETQDLFDFTKYDYIIDAVDTVTAKLQLIVQAKNAGTKIISCMGTGNKLNPTLFEICDISKTEVCPLARVMRQECKKRKITDVKVLFSREKPINPAYNCDSEKKGNAFAPASCAFVPSVAGLMIAAEVIKDLTKC